MRAWDREKAERKFYGAQREMVAGAVMAIDENGISDRDKCDTPMKSRVFALQTVNRSVNRTVHKDEGPAFVKPAELRRAAKAKRNPNDEAQAEPFPRRGGLQVCKCVQSNKIKGLLHHKCVQ